MRPSLAIALGAVCSFLIGSLTEGADAAFAGARLELLSQYEWRDPYEGFGGLSGLDLRADGARFLAVSDDGVLYSGRFERNKFGSVTGVKTDDIQPLVIEDGTRPDPKRHRDLEGLALSPTHGFYATAESRHRILFYADGHATPRLIALPDILKNMPSNRGFEALAVSQSGALVTLPEWSGGLTRAFPVYMSTPDGSWRIVYELPRHADFRPVGADFGPDGHLYVLERAFNGVGFAVRFERVLFEQGHPVSNEALFTSAFRDFDNLEGLAVWATPTGDIRITAVADDNFSRFQRTWLVDFVLRE